MSSRARPPQPPENLAYVQDLYHGMLERGMRKELARVTLARKIAALTLRLLKTGEVFDPTQLTRPQNVEGIHRPRALGCSHDPQVPRNVESPDDGAGGSLNPERRPGAQSCRGTKITQGPSAEPEDVSGQPPRLSLR